MNNKVILYGETHSEITDLLANNVKSANEQNKERAKRIYLNWIKFVNSLEGEGLCGLKPEYKKDSMTMFFDNGMVIVTENADGEIYLIKTKNIQEILTDWNGDCNFVPSNDAKVFFACWNGEPISPYKYTDFESLILHLRYLQIK